MKAQLFIGVLFLGVGLWILIVVTGLAGVVTGSVVGLLGADAVIASAQGREGLLAKLGPL